MCLLMVRDGLHFSRLSFTPGCRVRTTFAMLRLIEPILAGMFLSLSFTAGLEPCRVRATIVRCPIHRRLWFVGAFLSSLFVAFAAALQFSVFGQPPGESLA
ncbi:hypothetical protein FPV67DRAFT_1088022 [Lyophyllum atratum]|nr:hypothetical protein FPV67DRAFT_1088022 [Lyophyllum atratum]